MNEAPWLPSLSLGIYPWREFFIFAHLTTIRFSDTVTNWVHKMSSDEENDTFDDDKQRSSNMASNIASAVLFGNIDNEGRLIDDIFDDESKRHLNSLQPHLNSIVPYEDIIENDRPDVNESENSESESDTINETNSHRRTTESSDDNCKFTFPYTLLNYNYIFS